MWPMKSWYYSWAKIPLPDGSCTGAVSNGQSCSGNDQTVCLPSLSMCREESMEWNLHLGRYWSDE
jgi:hypothetical protein